MDKHLYKELWKIRFEKMLQLEKQSAYDYQLLLDECQSKFKAHPIAPHLERLISDEQKHTLLVEELLHILHNQPD